VDAIHAVEPRAQGRCRMPLQVREQIAVARAEIDEEDWPS
jgi:hypothetical protein